MATKASGRPPIPSPVKQALWIAAAGRCEFRGCNKPVTRDFLTKKSAKIAELAHIIGYSKDGPRGEEELSEQLAVEESNLLLTCYDCHSRIDRHGKRNEYSTDELRAMKREHEERIELVQSATGVKLSLPVVMTFPIAKNVPVVELADVHYAMLKNSGHTRFPFHRGVQLNRSDFDLHDGEEGFWLAAQRALEKLYQQRIHPELTSQDGPKHLTIAAFAPIPLLMKLGALIGNKTDAMVLDRPNEGWLWETATSSDEPNFLFEVPDSLPVEVVLGVSISNNVVRPAGGETFLDFHAEKPGRGIVRTQAQLTRFSERFNQFLLKVIHAGARVVHIYPATPLGVSVEVGRVLLPKTLDKVHVYDWQDGRWVPTLRLK